VVAAGRPGGSDRRVPSPAVVRLRGEGQHHAAPQHHAAGRRRAAPQHHAAGRRRAAPQHHAAGRRRGEGLRGPAGGPREVASGGRAAEPPGVSCSHGVAREAAAGRRVHEARGRDHPGSSRAGNQDAAVWLRPGRATAVPGSTPRLALPGLALRGLALRGLALPGPALLVLAAVRRSAGFPGCFGLLAPRARDHPWARRAGRPVSTRSSGSARAADRDALRRDRCLPPGR
jgi:hypothetical protein